jgi:hypothetical protein
MKKYLMAQIMEFSNEGSWGTLHEVHEITYNRESLFVANRIAQSLRTRRSLISLSPLLVYLPPPFPVSHLLFL